MKEGEISLTWEEEHTTPKKPGKSLTGADKSQRQKLIVSNLLNNFIALHESKMGTGLLKFFLEIFLKLFLKLRSGVSRFEKSLVDCF